MITRSEVERIGLHAAFWAATLVRDLRGLAAPARLDRQPLTDVNFEPTNLCNANCVFCGYQFQERSHAPIPVELGREIIAAAKRAGVTRLGLTPMVGEPLVHRRLEELVREAVAPPQPLQVGLTTNGILLDPARYRSLVDAGVTSFTVSMTYPDADEYLRIYRSKKLKQLVANLEGILDVYEPGVTFSLGIRTPRRDWEKHPLFRRARARGWEVVRNRLYDDWSGRTGAVMEAEGLPTRPNRPKRLPCLMTIAGPHFLSDGRATACGCRDLDGKSDLALAPAELLDDMLAVYATGAVDRLRERFRAGDAPEICQSCRHYNPTFVGEPLGLRAQQLAADVRAAVTDLATTLVAAGRGPREVATGSET